MEQLELPEYHKNNSKSYTYLQIPDKIKKPEKKRNNQHCLRYFS